MYLHTDMPTHVHICLLGRHIYTKNTKNKNNLFDTVRKLKLMPSKISHEIDDNAIENLKSRRN